MPRNVETILEDDDKKASLQVDEKTGEIIVDDIVDEGKSKKAADPNVKKTAEEEATELRGQLKKANERAAREAELREEAEQRVTTESAKVKTAFEQQVQGQLAAFSSEVEKAQTNFESIKQQLKQAKSANDTDAEVDLQAAMYRAQQLLDRAEFKKSDYEIKVENYKKDQEKRAVDPGVDSPYTKKERSWIKDHPEFNTNKKFARLAKLAAQEARDEELAQDSPEYFEYIENTLREAGLMGDSTDPTSGAGENVRKTSTSVAAAPQKSGGTSNPNPTNPKYPHIPRGFRIPGDWADAAETQGFEGKDGLLEYANMRLEEESKGPAQR